MNYIKETVKQPRLVNNFDYSTGIRKEIGGKKLVNEGIVKKHKVKKNSLSFQTIVLILFIIFFIFFLYNCKDGRMFGGTLIVDPIAYSFINS